MSDRSKLIPIIAVGALAAVALLTSSTRSHPVVERIDFGVRKTEVSPAHDAGVAPVSEARVKEFRIPMTHDTIEIATGVRYAGWTFGGTVPGPVIRVREGDLVRVMLVNRAKGMPHSIDFHASRIPMNQAMKSIAPGDSLQFEFTAGTPGVFMVHCGTAPVLMHIAQGMYLPIIVDPKAGWPNRADKEFVLVQSEFYPKPTTSDSTLQEGDWTAMLENRAGFVVFNGKANQYTTAPLQANPGDRVRLFVINAGPNRASAFHVVGTIFDAVYPGGEPAEVIHGVQTYQVPAGGGAVFETVFGKDPGAEGNYAFVTHAFADASRGAVGLIQVGHPRTMAAGR